MINNLNEVKKSEGIVVRKIGVKYYVLNKNRCYLLNETGILIVKYCGKDMDINEFCEKIVAKYNNKDMYEQVKKDIITFINFLIEINVLTCTNI